MHKMVIAASLLALVGAAPAFAASGAASGNGTSTLAGPAGKGGKMSHHKMRKMKSHKKAM